MNLEQAVSICYPTRPDLIMKAKANRIRTKLLKRYALRKITIARVIWGFAKLEKY